MNYFLEYLQKNNLFFLDSKTNNGSISKNLAAQKKVNYYARDIFLDNKRTHLAIAKQLIAAMKISFLRGKAIAIGHPYSQTYEVLKVLLPEMAKLGVEFQSLI